MQGNIQVSSEIIIPSESSGFLLFTVIARLDSVCYLRAKEQAFQNLELLNLKVACDMPRFLKDAVSEGIKCALVYGIKTYFRINLAIHLVRR